MLLDDFCGIRDRGNRAGGEVRDVAEDELLVDLVGDHRDLLVACDHLRERPQFVKFDGYYKTLFGGKR